MALFAICGLLRANVGFLGFLVTRAGYSALDHHCQNQFENKSHI